MLMFLICLSMFFINYLFFRDFRSPSVIQAGVWGVALLAYFCGRNEFLSIEFNIEAVVLIGIFAFSFGSILCLSFVRRSYKNNIFLLYTPLKNKRVFSYLYLLSFILLLLVAVYILGILKIALSGPTLDLATNLRYLGTQGEFPPYIKGLGYTLLLLNALSGFSLIHYLVSRERSMIILFSIFSIGAVAMSSVSLGRGIILFFLIEILSIVIYFGKKINLKYIFLGIIIFISIFYFGASILNKGVEEDGFMANINPLINSIVFYAAGGIVALSERYDSLVFTGKGENVFRTLFAFINLFGFDFKIPPLVQDYAFIPQPTNVYTMYFQYIKDFGIYGVVIVQLFLGVLHTVFYLRYRFMGDIYSLFWLSLLNFPLLTQPFTDGYASLLTTWVIYTILFFLLRSIFFKKESYMIIQAEKFVGGDI